MSNEIQASTYILFLLWNFLSWKIGKYFTLSFIVPVAINKHVSNINQSHITIYTSYIVPFYSSCAKSLQDPIGNYSFTFSFKGYILIYRKHSYFLQKKKKKESRWMVKEAGRLGVFGSFPSLQHTHFGEAVKQFHYRIPREVHVSDLPSWVAGSQGANLRVMLQRLWHVAGEACSHHCDGRKDWQLRCCREGEADIIEGSLRIALLRYPTQGPCSLQHVLKNMAVVVQTSSGCSFHCRGEVSVQADTATTRKGSVGSTQPGLGQGNWLLYQGLRVRLSRKAEAQHCLEMHDHKVNWEELSAARMARGGGAVWVGSGILAKRRKCQQT